MAGKQAWAVACEEYTEERMQARFGTAPVTTNGAPISLDDLKGKPKSSESAAIRWAAEHMGVDGLTLADAPSGLSYVLYTWCRANAVNRASFICSVLPRVLPSKPTVESDAFSDDGSIIALLDQIEKDSAEIKAGAMDIPFRSDQYEKGMSE